MSREHVRVVIAGGGVAALETLLALRALAGQRVEITLLTPEREFTYRPVTVAEAFERGEARTYDLVEVVGAGGGGDLKWSTLVGVDDHVALTGRGERVPFDMLVIAIGAAARQPFPGALAFRGRSAVPQLRLLLDEVEEGRARSIVFALPSEHMWSLPLYELALMTASHLKDHGVAHAKVSVVTPEDEPLSLLGPAAAEAIVPLLDAHGIQLHRSSRPAFVRPGQLVLVGGEVLVADRVVTLPLPEGRRLSGVAHDRHGFIPVDAHGRVRGLDDVYAAGDITAFPIKQGGLAAQQADVVAETIAAELDIPVPSRTANPVLRGLLMTGGAPLYVRAEPESTRASSGVAAIDAMAGSSDDSPRSAASGQPLWWPPAKIAARHLAPYLATARPQPLESELLTDREPVPGPPVSDAEHEEALDLALLLADFDAKWGDYEAALAALEAAEDLTGSLPPDYEAKRRQWIAARRQNGR